MADTDLAELDQDALTRIEEARKSGKDLVRAAHVEGHGILQFAAACAIGSDSDLLSRARDQAHSLLAQAQVNALLLYFNILTYEWFVATPMMPEFKTLLVKLDAIAGREFPGVPINLEIQKSAWISRASGRATLQRTTHDQANVTFWHDLETQFQTLACPHVYAVPGSGWWHIDGLPKDQSERNTLLSRLSFAIGQAVAGLGFTDASIALAVWLDFLTGRSPHYSNRCINNLCMASAKCCLELGTRTVLSGGAGSAKSDLPAPAAPLERPTKIKPGPNSAPIDSSPTKSLKSAVGRNIDRLRKECGWSFDDLARRSGFDKTSILDHVNKGSRPRPATLKVYAETFSKHLNRPVSVAELEA